MPTGRSELVSEFLPIAVITGLAAVLRFATLDGQSFGHDEAVTVAQVLEPTLGETLDAVHRGEATPPLYYTLAWAWTNLAGDGEFGVRSLSALAGTATVPVVYAAGRTLVSHRAA